MVIENEYRGKVAVVTGAARGIGKAIAAAYAAAGARVVLADKNTDNLEVARKEIRASSIAISVDVSLEESIQRLFEAVIEKLGRIDILINNAGIARPHTLDELTIDIWDQVINTNLRGTFLCSKEAAKYMKKNRESSGSHGGSIVNIASTRAIMSEPGWEAYAASKGGIISLTHALAASLAPDGIQVNCISPGWINTADPASLRPEDHSWHLSRRVGVPEDIGNACLFLTSESNRFVNGANLVIDGGATRKMVYPE